MKTASLTPPPIEINEQFAQALPFGGVQMVFIGDLYQLSPVVTSREREVFRTAYPSPYFFDARAFRDFPMAFIELEKIYRQKDDAFIRLLNAIRNNSATEADLAALNTRVDAGFRPAPRDLTIRLTTTNQAADTVNHQCLAELAGKIRTYTGLIQGDFGREYLPTEVTLHLKIGSQIMLLNNDSARRWVNGSMGVIKGIRFDEEMECDVLDVTLTSGRRVRVAPFTWEIFRTVAQPGSGALGSETVGTFTQYPVRLAWAVTIHKSQGKTFDRVIVDLDRGTFAPGQLYVALSRCTSLGGIVLTVPLKKNHILMDWRVVRFVTRSQYDLSEQRTPIWNSLLPDRPY